MIAVTPAVPTSRSPAGPCAGMFFESPDLVTIPGFSFSVTASAGKRAVAKRIAARALAATDFLHRVLGVTPRLALHILDRRDWDRHADVSSFGVTHVSQSGRLIVGAECADAWHSISDYFARHLPADNLAQLIEVHGLDPVNRRGPALAALAESLIAHEVAHLLALQEGITFRSRWLEEAFANYVLVAVLGETDPGGLRRLGSLAEAATRLAGMPTLDEFERNFGQMDVVPSVLAELEICRGVYAAYAANATDPLASLFAALRNAARARDADFEFGRMLAERVHPSIHAIPSRFAAARIGLAA
jgi:hypothetical protein